MSTITVETLLSDVKRLVIRLQRHDTAADSLIDHAIALKKKTESQATCPADPEDTEFSAAESNEDGGASQWESALGDRDDGASAAHSETRPPVSQPAANAAIDPSSVASSIHQPENSNITKLQRENKELRLLLEEHQIALDMIMTKYRERMSELISVTTTTPLKSNAAVVEELRGKTETFAAGIDLMYESTRKDETEEWEEIETIARLEAENRGLRELLAVSTKLGEEGAEEEGIGVADVTCISRQLSDEDGLYNSDHSQSGAPAGPNSTGV